MDIKLKKFGVTLTSRQLGREAYSGYSNFLQDAKPDEIIYVDFEGINTFSPSWGDEFLSSLHNKFGERLILKNINNPSVIATIKVLEEINKVKFKVE